MNRENINLLLIFEPQQIAIREENHRQPNLSEGVGWYNKAANNNNNTVSYYRGEFLEGLNGVVAFTVNGL